MTQPQDAVRDEALANLRTGTTALAEGKLERAAEALVYAETVFRQLHDTTHAADSRAALAEVQRQNGAVDQAGASYERAIELYKEANQPAREAGVTLALGHVERQRGQLDKAWEHYFLALRLFEKTENAGGQASASLALGHVERQRGHLEKAADYYATARRTYAAAHDAFGEADAAKGLADMLAGRSRYDEADTVYGEAQELYRAARDRFGEVDTLIGRGHLAMDRARLDDAATLFGDAISMASPLEYDLGIADGTLGLAEVSLHRGRLDQALSSGMSAQTAYDTAGNGLGAAEANRVLGEVQLRRGQIAASIAVFDRSARAFKKLHAREPYARALLGSGEANRRHANPRKAEDHFNEAKAVAQDLEQSQLESFAALGLARIARARGQWKVAAPALDEIARRFEQHGRLAATAHALVERARVALARGELDAARALAERARTLAEQSEQDTGEPGPISAAVAALAEIALALGDLESARPLAAGAVSLARHESDALPAIEAALLQAETELRADDLDAAVAAFNRAETLAREGEMPLAEGLARIGLARVLLQRGLWEEAANIHQEHVARIRAYDDVTTLALVYRGLAEARRGSRDFDGARQALAQARKLYAGSENPLGEAEAIQGEARLLLDVPEIEAAVGRYRQAIELVEAVGGGIADEAIRAGFYYSRAALYAEAILASARESNAERAREIARAYATNAARAGLALAAQRLREYEQDLPTRGSDLTKEQIEQNKAIGHVLAEARKALST